MLVSVRSVREASAALKGGACLIDIKEPLRGPLGRADDEVIARIVELVAGRRPVSAALGELIAAPALPNVPLSYVKWGLAGCHGRLNWRRALTDIITRQGTQRPRVVIAGYADWELAGAPPLAEVESFARHMAGGRWPGLVFLVDTFGKQRDPATGHRAKLLDWLSVNDARALCRRCHRHGLKVALAGSLGAEHIGQLRSAAPDWFAVRGAVCGRGERVNAVEEARVRQLSRLLSSPISRQP